jgi:UPF0042 nucleotide-binding protein
MSQDEIDQSLPAEVAPQVIIISGLSGSGKSTAIDALEDLGFFCIDNLPVPLLPKVLEIAEAGDIKRLRRLAFVVDTREGEFLHHFEKVVVQLREEAGALQVVFLDADDDILIRRYSQTRRPHPITESGSLRESIEIEREQLESVRACADLILDTTEHTVHSLKAALLERFTKVPARPLAIHVLSFGFKYGLAPECDLVFDVRFLKNPYFVEALRPGTGLDQEVFDFVLGQAEAGEFLRLFREYSNFLLPLYQREGKSYLTIGVGCTGGRHRSVSIGIALATRLRGLGWSVQISHRDVDRKSS